MTLQEYLTAHEKKPSAFAAEIGVPASTITRILNGTRSPTLALMLRIREGTGGLVTPNDYLPSAEPAPTVEAAE
ncbi:helix-turn-helix domain-containing protein [Microbaculum marinum]|uniref:helix-turn-helix domain-containing protein n=1 Tax=Microbaculum marinum TaxID=1764581 RepID=UPI00360C2735